MEEVRRSVFQKIDDKPPLLGKSYNALTIVDIKIESEDQNLIVLCSLPPSYDTFADTLIYGKDNISLDDVSNALKSKELKKNFPDSRTEGEEHSIQILIEKGLTPDRSLETGSKTTMSAGNRVIKNRFS
ncbi:hypothetical protein KY285_027116 [Solanum tuberosum]|nr:hypothetical protein KY285_027116 [Solanum tuberosum]